MNKKEFIEGGVKGQDRDEEERTSQDQLDI